MDEAKLSEIEAQADGSCSGDDRETMLATVTAERDDARAALATARREGAEQVLAMSDPWPLHDVLAKLAEASRVLLNRYNYDGHGWEMIRAACDSAEAIIARVQALALDSDGGALACTGTTASWCPRCGDCTCPWINDNPDLGRTLDCERCPLHALSSTHGSDGGTR